MARILVMEDDAAVRKAEVTMLREVGGHEVIAFPDARPALEGMDFAEFDLVITNLRMPTPGDQAIRHIRAQGLDVPIVVISAYLDKETKVQLLNLGAQETMEKPFTLSALLSMVDRWTDSVRPCRQGAVC